jgi:hypothetical protein
LISDLFDRSAERCRTIEEINADLLRAQGVLAIALNQDPGEIAEASAILLAAGAWWIEDVLARPTAERLLGVQGREMLKALRRQPLPSDASLCFEAALRTLYEEAALTRRRPGDHALQRLLLRLLGVLWTLVTGKSMSKADRDNTPLARFLDAMTDPLTGLPGITRQPAAIALRRTRSPRTLAAIARGRNK